jgi:hypothetical protein
VITPGPASLPAVDDVALYWAASDGSVMAACKPR